MFHLSVLSPSDSDIPKIHLLFLLVSDSCGLPIASCFCSRLPLFHRLTSSNARLTIPTTAAAPPSTRYQTVSACVHPQCQHTSQKSDADHCFHNIFFQRPSSFFFLRFHKKIFRRFRFLFFPKCFLHLYRRIFSSWDALFPPAPSFLSSLSLSDIRVPESSQPKRSPPKSPDTVHTQYHRILLLVIQLRQQIFHQLPDLLLKTACVSLLSRQITEGKSSQICICKNQLRLQNEAVRCKQVLPQFFEKIHQLFKQFPQRLRPNRALFKLLL